VIVHDHVETPPAITPKPASTIAEMRTTPTARRSRSPSERRSPVRCPRS